MSYRLLQSYEFAHEAYLHHARLQDAEIPCFLKNETMVSLAPHYSNAVGGVQLYVHANNYKEAVELISFRINDESHLEQSLTLESADKVTSCPKCSSTNVIYGRSIWSGLTFLILFMLPVSLRNKKLHCGDCSHVWKQRI